MNSRSVGLFMAAVTCRFTAVTRPISYARQKTSRRVYVMIAAPWVVSLAISSPIALGLNRTARRADTPRLCTFYNSDFLIYSSMGSFYVPTIVMIVLYWRVYLTIRLRRCASTSSARSQQTRPANESISCTAIEAHRDDADCTVTGGCPASNGDAVLSAVAATLNAVQRRGEELARRVAAAAAVDGMATVEQSDTPLPPDDEQCMTPRPPIAVIDTDDLATLSPPSTPDRGVGTVPLTRDKLTPMSLSMVDVDGCGVDKQCMGTVPKMLSSSWTAIESTSTLKNTASTQAQKVSEAEQDGTARPQASLPVPPSALQVSSLCPGRAGAGCGVEPSTLWNSDEDDGQTVMRVELASPPAAIPDRVNGRFVTFFNFTSKQRSTASTGAADRRFKRAVRRERRATKTLVIVLGNLFITCFTNRLITQLKPIENMCS